MSRGSTEKQKSKAARTRKNEREQDVEKSMNPRVSCKRVQELLDGESDLEMSDVPDFLLDLQDARAICVTLGDEIARLTERARAAEGEADEKRGALKEIVRILREEGVLGKEQ